MFKHHVLAVVVAIVLTAISYGAGLYFNWITEVSWLEAFSVFTSYWCTYLCVFQSRFNYIIGAISVAALCFLFYEQKLFSSMVLQIYLFPTLAYGWWFWGKDTNTRPVTLVDLKNYPIYLMVTIFVAFLCVDLNIMFGGVNPFWDTSILVMSILAQFLMDRKKLENWIVWIAVDIVSVFLYWNQDLKILAIQMGIFGLNAILGLIIWYNSMKNQSTLIEDKGYDDWSDTYDSIATKRWSREFN